MYLSSKDFVQRVLLPLVFSCRRVLLLVKMSGGKTSMNGRR